jgi:Tol biopolymer transport system component
MAIPSALVVVLMIGLFAAGWARADDPLTPWRNGVKIRPVCQEDEAHTIHTYFNVSPESPDGRFVLFFRSVDADAHVGDICLLERATGKRTVVARNIEVTDAHTVAGQQWVAGGRTVVYKKEVDGHWLVMAVDADGSNERVLATDLLAGLGQPHGTLVPVSGTAWKLGEHRDLEMLDVLTGKIQTVLTNDAMRAAYSGWIQRKFGDRPTCIIAGILSPDLNRVIFKVGTPASGNVKSMDSSDRDGLCIYDITQKKCLPMQEYWGHPSWYKDSKTIVQMHDWLIDSDTGKAAKIPNLPDYYSTHPTSSPDGTLQLKDMAVPEPGVDAKNWNLRGIDLCDIRGGSELIIDKFDNSHGAKSWRVSHPHPAFSADGRRIYYNVSSGPWTRLFVAERTDAQ